MPEGPLRRLVELWAGGESELLGEMPGDAWGALALPKVGESAQSLFSSFAGAIGGAALNEQVKQSTGLDLEHDVFSWLGDVGVFVRGADMASSAARSCSVDRRRAGRRRRSASSSA